MDDSSPLTRYSVLSPDSRHSLHRDFHLFTEHCRYLLVASSTATQSSVSEAASEALNVLPLEDYVFYLVDLESGCVRLWPRGLNGRASQSGPIC